MSRDNHYDMIIIGGGASGLCTAIMSKTDANRILIIEHNDRVGKKILSTGNGKCNLTNLNCKVVGGNSKTLRFIDNPEGIRPYYSSADNGFAEQVINNFDADAAVSFFEGLGMIPLDKNGYIYPRSEQASSILDMLRFKCEEVGVDIVCGYQPVKIYKQAKLSRAENNQNVRPKNPDDIANKTSEVFIIDDEYTCDKLVIATGGQSASKTGSDGSGYEVAKAFGHTVIKPLPGLCALKCSDQFFKELAGVRTDAELSLFDLGIKKTSKKEGKQEGKDAENSVPAKAASADPIMTVSGNLQFNNYGISGIPVFQLSLTASRLLAEGHELLVKINLLPELSEEELAEKFLSIIDCAEDNRAVDHKDADNTDTDRNAHNQKNKAEKISENVFLGILNKKLAHVIEKESYKAHPNEKKEDYAYVFTHMIQRFKVHPTETVSFEDAQTTLGGVSTKEIDPNTMESKLIKGLFFTGEVVDVSGICGGYNLQWAWSTANAVSRTL